MSGGYAVSLARLKNIFEKRPRLRYVALGLIHALLCIVAFKDFRMSPGEVLFCDYGDGMKNYFTLQSYVAQPAAHGLWRYTGMAYPFGDYVYYTDNTPLFSIPFRWLCLHVHDWSAYTLPVYNCFLILNIILCGLLAFSIFRRCINHNALAFAVAIVLPWINPMILRIPAGHQALSMSSAVLSIFWLVVRWQQAGSRRGLWTIGCGAMLCIVGGFLLHGYFLPILAGFWTSALLAAAWLGWKRRRKDWKSSLLGALVVPGASAILVGLLINATDGFAALRTHRDMGYDWMEMKTRALSFFSRYHFQKVYFPVESPNLAVPLESSCYLGSIGLWLLSVMLVLLLLKPSLRPRFRTAQQSFFTHPVLLPLAFAAVLLLSISFGERYYTGPDGVVLTNIFNPFLYLRPLVPKLENFRALARFSWPFFFLFYIWLLFTARLVFGGLSSKRLRTGLAAGLAILGGLEVKDFVDYMQAQTSDPNLLSKSSQSQTFKSTGINFSQYQALLPLPLYVVGAEEGTLVIDDHDVFTTQTYALSLHSKLPLMSVKLSRTPKQYSRALLQTFAADRMPRFMRRRMDNRPILLAFSRGLAADSNASHIPPDRDDRREARAAYFAALDFPRRHRLQPIDSAGDLLFYSWQPPPLAAP